MRYYNVYARKKSKSLVVAGAPESFMDNYVFVKEGFCFWALMFGPLWILYKKLWIPFMICCILQGMAIFVRQYGLNLNIGQIIAWSMAFVGNDLLEKKLLQQDYELIDVIMESGPLQAERRFFDKLKSSKLK